MTTPVNAVDYTAKDFSGFRDSMLSYASAVIPEWTSRAPADFGVAIVEMLAYCLDILSYYQDRLVSEAYLDTATQRSSVLEIARMLGYTPYPAAAAQGSVTLVSDPTQTTGVLVPQGTQLITQFQTDIQGPLIFETTADVTVPASGGSIPVGVVEGATQSTDLITLTTASTSPQSIPVITLGAATGEVDQQLTIPQKPVDQSTVRIFTNYPSGPVEWLRADSLLDSAGTARVFALSTDADGIVSVNFGDGVNGAAPENGVPVLCAYRVGGGIRGNLGANALVDVAAPLIGVSVQSSSATLGGLDAESNDSIRRNAPAAFSIQDRAVTVPDYAAAAGAVPGCDKANALAQAVSMVTVFILGAGNSPPTQELIEATTQYVQTRAMAGTTVLVQPGTLVPVNFGSTASPVTLGVRPQFRRTDVQLAVTQALQNMLAPNVTTFQQRVTIAQAYAAVHDIPGVLYVQIPVMARADQAQTGASDIVCREWETPVAGDVNITAVGGV